MLHKCDRAVDGVDCQNHPVHGYWCDGSLGPTIYLCDEHAKEYPELVDKGLTDGEITEMTWEEEVTSDIMDS
jgi:hypothetical protein